MICCRFGITDGRPHSAGGVYLSINNLRRRVRYSQRNIMLVTMIPGPKEPSLEQMNHALEPLVKRLNQLYIGTLSPLP